MKTIGNKPWTRLNYKLMNEFVSPNHILQGWKINNSFVYKSYFSLPHSIPCSVGNCHSREVFIRPYTTSSVFHHFFVLQSAMFLPSRLHLNEQQLKVGGGGTFQIQIAFHSADVLKPFTILLNQATLTWTIEKMYDVKIKWTKYKRPCNSPDTVPDWRIKQWMVQHK